MRRTLLAGTLALFGAACGAACGGGSQARPTTVTIAASVQEAPMTTPAASQTPPDASVADAPAPAAGAGDAHAAAVFRTVATVIQTGTNPPMIAFALRESFPPQGGDVVLHGFSWDDVEGEQTEGDVIWLDEVEFVGRRTTDGGFELTQPAAPGTSPLSPLTYNQLTPGCQESTYRPMLAKLDALDATQLGILASSEYTFDLHCGVVVTAQFDTPELRAAVHGALGDRADVSYEAMFVPADAGTATNTGGTAAG